jgi:hypothetical protein
MPQDGLDPSHLAKTFAVVESPWPTPTSVKKPADPDRWDAQRRAAVGSAQAGRQRGESNIESGNWSLAPQHGPAPAVPRPHSSLRL